MTTSTYLIDSALVLLVALQIKERPLTLKQLLRPVVILTIAVASYLHGIPTSGNDLILLAGVLIIGGTVGALSGQTVRMRTDENGRVLTRTGWSSACFWVLGMGSRMAFAIWSSTASGIVSIHQFSVQHSITSGEAWTVAILGMAVAEVLARTAVLAIRSRELSGRRVLQVAAA